MLARVPHNRPCWVAGVSLVPRSNPGHPRNLFSLIHSPEGSVCFLSRRFPGIGIPSSAAAPWGLNRVAMRLAPQYLIYNRCLSVACDHASVLAYHNVVDMFECLWAVVNDPDVAVSDRVAVILQSDGIRIRRFLLAGSRFTFDVEVVLHHNAIVLHC